MEHDLKFWKKLATDMVVVLGNNPYMANIWKYPENTVSWPKVKEV